jgi:site-specific DNA-cytosine methylase
LFENVPGWLQGEHEAAKCLCGALGGLGFRPLWGEVLNAREFGAPQDRNRVILLFGRDSDLPTFRERNRAVGRRPTRGRPLRKIQVDELGPELSAKEVAAISKRLAVRSGSSKPSRNMLQKCREFTGSAEPRMEWKGKAVFHSARNPRCFQPGFSPTVTKDARLLVRLPESGQIFKVAPRGYERLMAVKTDLTRYGLTQEGREYVIKDKHRADMCGDGVCAPIVEWIARAVSDLLGG